VTGVRGVTLAVGVREIPRLCEPCQWVADRSVRPAVYHLQEHHPECPYGAARRRDARTANPAAPSSRARKKTPAL